MTDPSTDPSVEQQAAEQTGKRQVRLRMDNSDAKTSYANAFRTNATAEEAIVEFGFNLVNPTPRQQGDNGENQIAGEMVFESSNRVIMNFYTAKRLAISLSQMVRGYEQRFGELKLNAAEREQSTTASR